MMDLAKNLKIDSVRRLDLAEAIVLAPGDTVAEAVRRMREHHAGCVLVSAQGNLVGIFTERDLVKRVLAPAEPLTTPLRACMTPEPATVRHTDPIGVALRRMHKGGYRHLPVVCDDGKPVGVLSVKRIVHYLVEHFPAFVLNQPPNPEATCLEREGA
jgi:CBS domain-containing protein